MKFIDMIAGGLFGDTPWTANEYDAFAGDNVSELFPWRLHDAESGLFLNESSIGFIFEATTVTSDSDVASNLHSVLAANVPAGVTIQVMSWSSPNISQQLMNWSRVRGDKSDVVDAISEQRCAMFQDHRFGDLTAPIKNTPHNKRVFIAAWVEANGSLQQKEDLLTFRDALRGCWSSGREFADLGPAAFLSLISEISHASGWTDDEGEGVYSEQVPLNYQLPGLSLGVHPEGLQLGGTPSMGVTVSAVANYPQEWAFSLGSLLNGMPEKVSERPGGPVLMSFVMRPVPPEKAEGQLVAKRSQLEYLKSNQTFGRFVPDLGGKDEEFASLASELAAGEVLFETCFLVCSYGRGGVTESRNAASEMQKIFRRPGLRFVADRFLQLPLFLCALPFFAGRKEFDSLKKSQRMRLLKGKAVSELAPIHGEWTGNSPDHGILLTGRLGQIFCWDNFTSTGNYNVAVIGKSGAGKSVLMQELVCSIFSSGGHVLVIDDGYSFENSCKIFDGKHIAFNDDVDPPRLNPISLLDPIAMKQDGYRADAIELLTRIVATMAELSSEHTGRVANVEEDFFGDAIARVWDEKGRAGEITDVRDVLMEQSKDEPRLIDVIRKLGKFCRGGQYGGYFSGPSNLTLGKGLTVVELSDVKSMPGLQDVVLQLVMFLGTELMFKTPKDTRVAIVIDEAWDLLQAHGTAAFIEGVVRRARKYTGALITGTQSVGDYLDLPSSKVCWENSDVTIYLAQKPDTIDRLPFEDPGIAQHLKTLTQVPGMFAELAIKSPEGWAFARLMLDPFSLAALSSKGSTRRAIEQQMQAGLSLVEAVQYLVDTKQVA